MNTLVFRLYAPMASWSVPAIGEHRHTHDTPTAGMVIGLLAAALGIRREEESKQLALRDNLTFAVKTISRGSLMRDYHTIQMPPTRKGTRYFTRKSELADHDALNTMLTSRDYRCDGLWIVAVRVNNHAPHSLEQLAHALKHPVFTLYLGRKACPLAAPLMPSIVEAKDWRSALDQPFPPLPLWFSRTNQKHPASHTDSPWHTRNPDGLLNAQRKQNALLHHAGHITYHWSGDITDMQPNIPINQIKTDTRWDEPLSRTRWQFRPRHVHSWQTSETS